MRSLSAGLLLLIVFFCPSSNGQESRTAPVVVIAHAGVPVDALPRNTVRAMFAMRQRSWPTGSAVRVFVLPDRDPVHARFVKEQLDVFPHQLQLSWDRVVFSGTGQAPGRADSQIDMLQRVATTPGAIGYVERTFVDDRVRVLNLD
ncbi:hypothetical protein J2T57_004066 [Natronocella acetinitrilica]|uniref:PBP domain-containing protein n=1 Tax=Natronocella acetinitrilica TaxID=414046 RepID=A0AAE3G7K4_9GAMM|nr:hypothetical protein [Natronocella acetinitrilica]MCP1676892.1 hypothetical protein [Natronocella acetinitrilica]